MRAGQFEIVTQAVGKSCARLDVRLVVLAIDSKLDTRGAGHASSRSDRPAACASARSVKTPSQARRYSPGAWMSSAGSTLSLAAAAAAEIIGPLTTWPLITASA